MRQVWVGFMAVFLFLFSGCESKESQKVENRSASVAQSVKNFHILSGSENKTLEPLLKRFGAQNGVKIEVHYKGSVDIMRELQTGAQKYDSVWPANSLWIALGDTHKKVKYSKSIMTSPVVFGIKKSKAKELGFIGKDVYIKDILEKIRSKELRFTMTSATQSNSGASSYIGFLYAMLGNPEVLALEDLSKESLRKQTKEFLAGVNRSSGSSGWLKTLFLKGGYDAMVNYEAMLIEANQELSTRGEEPLYAIYPRDGLSLADSPLGYVNHGHKEKEELFLKLQSYLLSAEVQKELTTKGRRTGLGATLGGYDPSIFRAEWGVDTKKILNFVKMPTAEVIFEALNLYQTELRKPSLTIFALDYSGSMNGAGERAMEEAMDILLSDKSKEYFLQPTSEDKIVVIPFNHSIIHVFKGGKENFSSILRNVVSLNSQGGTDIYKPVIEGLKIIKNTPDFRKYNVAIILMTDGISEDKNKQRMFNNHEKTVRALEMDIPVFSIAFGNADLKQLHRIAERTRARVFNGKKDLIKAFRQAKGYN